MEDTQIERACSRAGVTAEPVRAYVAARSDDAMMDMLREHLTELYRRIQKEYR